MKATFFLLLGLPLAAAAQPGTTSVPDSSRRDEPAAVQVDAAHSSVPAVASAEAVQQHLLASDVNLAWSSAHQLPNLYERFIGTVREERRAWNYAQWEAAGQVLARLNQRYEQVRGALPLEERLRIRAFQGEFRTLRATRPASK